MPSKEKRRQPRPMPTERDKDEPKVVLKGAKKVVQFYHRMGLGRQRLEQTERQLQEEAQELHGRVDRRKAEMEEGLHLLQNSIAHLHRAEWDLRQLHHTHQEMDAVFRNLKSTLPTTTRTVEERRKILQQATETMTRQAELLAEAKASAETHMVNLAGAAAEFSLRLDRLRTDEGSLRDCTWNMKRCKKDLDKCARFQQQMGKYLQPVPAWQTQSPPEYGLPKLDTEIQRLQEYSESLRTFLHSQHTIARRKPKSAPMAESNAQRHFAILRSLRELPDLPGEGLAKEMEGEVEDPVTGMKVPLTKTQRQEAMRLQFAHKISLRRRERELLKEKHSLLAWDSLERQEQALQTAEHRVWLAMTSLKERREHVEACARSLGQAVSIPLSLFNDCPRGTPPYHNLLLKTRRRSTLYSLLSSAADGARGQRARPDPTMMAAETAVLSLVEAYKLKNRTALSPEAEQALQRNMARAKTDLEECYDYLNKEIRNFTQCFENIQKTIEIAREEVRNEEEEKERAAMGRR